MNHGRSGDLVVEGVLEEEGTGEKATWILAIPGDGAAPIAVIRNGSTIELEPGNPVAVHLTIEELDAAWSSSFTGTDGGVIALRGDVDGEQAVVAITVPEAD